MSVITYIAQKTSTSIEKTSFAASGGITIVIFYHFILDFFFEDKILPTFTIEQLLLFGNPRQFEFLISTLLLLGIITVMNPIERILQYLLGSFYSHYIITNDTYHDQSKIYQLIAQFTNKREGQVLASEAFERNFPRMYLEIAPLKEKYQLHISRLYLGITLLLCLLISGFAGFNLIQTSVMENYERQIIGIGLIFFFLLLINVVVWKKVIPNSYQDLRRSGLLVFHAFVTDFSLNAESALMTFTRSGQWTVLRRLTISELEKFEKELVPSGFDLRKLRNYDYTGDIIKDYLNETEDFQILGRYKNLSAPWGGFPSSDNPVIRLTVPKYASQHFLHYYKPAVDLILFFTQVPNEIAKDKQNLNDLYRGIRPFKGQTEEENIFDKTIFKLFSPDSPHFNLIKQLAPFDLNSTKLSELVDSSWNSILQIMEPLQFQSSENENLFNNRVKEALMIVFRQYHANALLTQIVGKINKRVNQEIKLIGL